MVCTTLILYMSIYFTIFFIRRGLSARLQKVKELRYLWMLSSLLIEILTHSIIDCVEFGSSLFLAADATAAAAAAAAVPYLPLDTGFFLTRRGKRRFTRPLIKIEV